MAGWRKQTKIRRPGYTSWAKGQRIMVIRSIGERYQLSVHDFNKALHPTRNIIYLKKSTDKQKLIKLAEAYRKSK